MGQDFSYSQPSSSEFDTTSLLLAEAELYAAEVESDYSIDEPVHYPTQPEADEGIPTTCYCGAEVDVETSYTRKDPGRRYYTCVNAHDGECHIWKWSDVAMMEELRDYQTQLRLLKEQFFESEHKVAKLEKTMGLLLKKKSGVANKSVCLLVMVIAVMIMGWKIFGGFKPTFLHCFTDNGPLRVPYLSLCVANKATQTILYPWRIELVIRTFCTAQLNLIGSVDLGSPEPYWFGSQAPEETVVESAANARRKWSPREDTILIGAWLNTSKDPIVGNEQKAGAFWKRIVEYYNASPLLVGTVTRELGPCKQRWARINEQVCKFVGSYNAALREQRSGENDDDVMKVALDLFFTAQGSKFSLEHAWRELRHDQKWSSTYLPKEGGKDKRKQGLEVDTEDEVGEPESRPIGVKAAKANAKRKKSGKEEELSQLQAIMEVKQKLSKQKLLDRLLGKKDALTEMEESLKLKLMSEML